MYFDDKLKLHDDSETKTVYRYFGGDSMLQGGYFTDREYDTPEEAKKYLALSDVDWDSVNTADNMAILQVEVTPDGHLVDQHEMTPTDEVLEWSIVQPTSDYSGGGNQYCLQNDFNDIVEVTDELYYNPDWGYTSRNNPYSSYTEEESIDELIDDEIYYMQKNDVEEVWTTEMGMDNYIYSGEDDFHYVDDTDNIQNLLDDEEYDIQKDLIDDEYVSAIGMEEFTTDNYDVWDNGWDDASIDNLLDDEEWEIQKSTVDIIPDDDPVDDGRDERTYNDEY